LQLWLQLGCGESAPENFRHAVGRVLAEGSGDVRVALGLAELRVPEDLLYDPDADTLVEQQGRRRVAGIMDPGVAEAGRTDECTPVFPVVARVYRRAEGRAEDEVPVLPGRSGGEAFRGLLSAVRAELVDERGRKRQDEFGLALTGFDSLSAGEMPATADALARTWRKAALHGVRQTCTTDSSATVPGLPSRHELGDCGRDVIMQEHSLRDFGVPGILGIAECTTQACR
jgi:hypothetical protein